MTDSTAEARPTVPTGMIALPGGSYQRGSTEFYPEEGPVMLVEVAPFELDRAPVSNRQFSRFVADTGYITVAERMPDPADYPGANPADLVPGALVFAGTPGPVNLGDWRQWWDWVPGATWRHPYGGASSITDKDDHPVVQIAYEDATTYAAWAGKRLPTETEWEYAARGGLEGRTYSWGDEPQDPLNLRANSWQGDFPFRNTGARGWVGTSPVGTFEPNGFGLVDMCGNTWEWTSDFYTPSHRPVAPAVATGLTAPVGLNLLADSSAKPATESEGSGDPANAGGCGPSCACGPSDSNSRAAAAASAEPGSTIPRRVLKGGSHLCAPEYCLRYRPAARSPQAEDTSTTHIGFRCARTV
ncbi:formylglycine-generating enzyme family protein [Leifsonia sp. YAF41]|uniref:formylglycine-generating enzyme family protein n=1 Tax=Leifsonia sp. YAF41 TaxID=3233086 RepID=UPI003F94CB23